jgi:hypothetical protein
MTSSSQRKRQTTVWNSARRSVALAVALAAGVLAAGACQRRVRDPLLTYISPQFHISIQYAASWRTEEAHQEGVWYRYFLAPTTGASRKSAVSATLLAGPLPGTLDEYAQTYLAGNTLGSTRDERRPGLIGKSYAFTAPGGATRYSLLLLKEQPLPAGNAARVFGLYCQGDAASFAQYAAALDEMAASVTLERPQDWNEIRVPGAKAALRVPGSWRFLRRTSGQGIRIEQFTSPALGVDKGGQTVHASLTLSVEPAPDGLDAYYRAVKRTLGPNFAALSHADWKGGYADVLHVETPMASSSIQRFYRVSGGSGYSLICEARDDVYPRAAPWCDLIAASLRVGPEAGAR